MLRSAYTLNMVADVLAPNRLQAIRYNHADFTERTKINGIVEQTYPNCKHQT